MKLIKSLLYLIRGMKSEKWLRKNGCVIGENFSMQPGSRIDISHCFLVEIGNNVTLAPNVHILAHDASTKRSLGYTKIGIVNIGDDTFVGASSIILPNVRIGKNCIIGAGSIVTKDIPDNSVVVGNPAKFICLTNEYLNNNKIVMKNRPSYDSSFRLSKNLSNEKKLKMKKELSDGIGFIV